MVILHATLVYKMHQFSDFTPVRNCRYASFHPPLS